MKTKKILVTGGTGFVGANLVRKLVSLGHKPTVLVRKGSNLWRLRDLLSKVKLVQTDMSDYKRLKSDLKKIRPNFIYHLATYGANQSLKINTQELIDVNVLGTTNLLDISCEIGFEYFINTGSSSEYGIKEKSMKENDFIAPINFYGATKASSTLISTCFSKNKHLPIVTMRLFSPYGYFEDRSRLVPHAILSALHNRKLTLSSPNYVRDFVFIEDVITTYINFLTEKKYYGEVFNVGSGNQHTIKNVIDIIEEKSGIKLKVQWKKRASNQQEPIKWEADMVKTRHCLNRSVNTSLTQGLSKTVDWFMKNLALYNEK